MSISANSPIRRAGRPAPQRARRLFCLPPAGAAASLFYPWLAAAPADIDVCPVSLPGREDRLREPLPASIDALADALAPTLALALDRPYALVGYSMGALLGYELVGRWLRAGLPGPQLFVALAARAPHAPFRREMPLHSLPRADFRAMLADLGGTPKELLENEDAMSLFEPILRNDLRISETYLRSVPVSLGCPVLAVLGEADSLLDAGDVRGWEDASLKGFKLAVLPGEAHMLSRHAFTGMLDRLAHYWSSLWMVR